jgi:hypothetical protein
MNKSADIQDEINYMSKIIKVQDESTSVVSKQLTALIDSTAAYRMKRIELKEELRLLAEEK